MLYINSPSARPGEVIACREHSAEICCTWKLSPSNCSEAFICFEIMAELNLEKLGAAGVEGFTRTVL